MAFNFDFGFGLMSEYDMNVTIFAYQIKYGVNGGTLETEVWNQVTQLVKESLMECPADPLGRIQITRRLRTLIFGRERTMVSRKLYFYLYKIYYYRVLPL